MSTGYRIQARTGMFTPRILSDARFSIRELRIQVCTHEWPSTPSYDAVVDCEWERLLRATSQLWDGTYYRVLNLEDWATSPVLATMQLGTISYRYIATFRAMHEHHIQSALDPLNHVSTVALIQAGDGSYLFGCRARDGAMELIGGGVQRDELSVFDGTQIEQNFYKEIHEEVGIREDDMEVLAGIGIAYSSTSNVLIVGHARTRLSADEIREEFDQRGDDEMSDLIFVPESKLRDFLHRMPDYRNLIPQLLAK